LTALSWYEARPAKSLEYIRYSGVRPEDPIIDVGGGASFLVDTLLELGYHDLTVLDVSATALEKLRERLGARAPHVMLLNEDVTRFQPARRYALWHDRAVFHFLVRDADRAAYGRALRAGLRPDGQLVIATFGPAAPERCSGLPVVRYGAAELAHAIGADFELVESSQDAHRTPAGNTQQFQYCRFRRAPPGTGAN
jgi:SAM-dependent methyltransferase